MSGMHKMVWLAGLPTPVQTGPIGWSKSRSLLARLDPLDRFGTWYVPSQWSYNSSYLLLWFHMLNIDLVNFHKLLEVDETVRLGSQGPDSVKSHQWFAGIDWEGIREKSFPIPPEITTRINQHLEIHVEDLSGPLPSPSHDVPELNTSEWLEDWWKGLKRAVLILDSFQLSSTMSESMQNRASEMLSRNWFYLNNPPPSRLMVNFALKFEELLSAFHIFSWTLHMIHIQEILD